MVKRNAAILLLLMSAFLVCALIYLEKWSSPKTIQATRGRSQIFFEVNHHTQVFSPLLLTWDLKEAKIVQANGWEGYHQQQGSRQMIGIKNAAVAVEFPDGEKQTYHLPVTVLFKTWQGWLILLALSVMPYTAGVLLNFMTAPGALAKSVIVSTAHRIRQFKKSIRTEEPSHLVVLSGILVFAAGIRLLYLNQPARLDESITFIFYADPGIPLRTALSNYSLPNNHPLNTLLIQAATLLLNSINLWVIRLPAFFAGMLLVLATYVATRLVYNKNAGLLAAGLTASASTLILYSTNARGYIFVFLFFIILIGIACHLIHRNSPTAWLLFILAATFGFYSMPLMAYPYGIVGVWIILSAFVIHPAPEQWRTIRDLGVASACVCWLTLLLFLPFLVENDVVRVLNRDYASFMSLSDCFMYFINSMKGLAWMLNDGLAPWISILLLSGFIAAFVFHRHLSRHKIPVVAAIAIGMGLIILIQRPYFRYARLLLFLLPVYFMVASAGIIYLLERALKTQTNRKYVILLFAVAVIATNAYAVVQSRTVYRSTETGALHSAEDITLLLKDDLHSEDRIFSPIPFLQPIFQYYFRYYGMDADVLATEKTDLTSIKRMFIVVYNNREGAMTVEDVLDEYQPQGYRRSEFGEALLIKSYEFSKLYAIQRK